VNPQSSSGEVPKPGVLPPAVQGRSRITAELFVEAALDLLRTRTFDELSVADMAKRAGRSVGAFYQRFGSKDDFLASLLISYMLAGERAAARLLAESRDEGLLEAVLTESYEGLMRNRNLWHAALRKSAQNPGFWAQFLPIVQQRSMTMATRLGELRGRPLDRDEVYRLRVATQVFNSVINNQILNNPGPLTLNTPEFLPTALAIFRAVRAMELPAPVQADADR